MIRQRGGLPACDYRLHLFGVNFSNRAGDVTHVRDFALTNLANLLGGERQDRDRLSIQRSKLELIALAVPVDQHDRADVASHEAMLRQVAIKNYDVQFTNHVDSLLSGCAVANRGTDSLRLINHTLRTFKRKPSGARSTESMT